MLTAVGQQKKWNALDDLEEHVVDMALRYRSETDGQLSAAWAGLLSHLSRWSSKYPLRDALETAANTVMVINESEQKRRQDDASRDEIPVVMVQQHAPP